MNNECNIGLNVHAHLVQFGIIRAYVNWVEHGEPRISASTDDSRDYDHQMEDNENEVVGRIDDMLEDRVMGESDEMTKGEQERDFEKLLDDSKHEI